MAFKLTQKPTFTVPVKVYMPNDKGTFDVSDFNVVFHRPNLEELDELREMKPRDAMTKTIVGWDNLVDEGNAQVGFNEDNLQALLVIPQALKAVNEAFWNSLFKAAEKN